MSNATLFAEWIETETQADADEFMAAPEVRPVPSESVACPKCSKRVKVPSTIDRSRARCPRCREKLFPPMPEHNRRNTPIVAFPPEPEAVPLPAPVPVKAKPVGKLVDVYRPQTISDLAGQDNAQDSLATFMADPQSGAFIFSGPTGTGKTSAALALAAELGLAVEFAECGGLHQISSGEQTGDTVRAAVRGLWCRPMFGSGWRVLIVNEADCMTANAAYTWLDQLENLPPRCVVIFTTNESGKLPRRLRDRCEEVAFIGGSLLLRAPLQALASRVWTEQTGRTDCPDLDSFGQWSADGEASFRRLLQLMEAPIRNAKRGGEFVPCLELAEPVKPGKRGRK